MRKLIRMHRQVLLEYIQRKSKEAILVKDADLLDQILLLREYEWQGNKEAGIWLHKGKKQKGEREITHLQKLKSPSAKKLGMAIYKGNPSDWWDNLWTPNNRKH